jgi:hypothetical protein
MEVSSSRLTKKDHHRKCPGVDEGRRLRLHRIPGMAHHDRQRDGGGEAIAGNLEATVTTDLGLIDGNAFGACDQ